MSDIDYYQKYLKYKSKYTNLKAKMYGSQSKRLLNPLLQDSGFRNEFEKSLIKLDICSSSNTLFILEDLLKETNRLNKSGLQIVLSHFIVKRPLEELVSQLSPHNNNPKALELARKLINSCSILEQGSFRAKKMAKATADKASSLQKSVSKGASQLGKATVQGASNLKRSASEILDNNMITNLVSNSLLPF